MQRNDLTILNVTIRQNEGGLYSLNDFHRASGGKTRHQPAQFLRLDSTRELAQELSDMGNPISVVRGGPSQGSYVCREIVYAYAMWISSKFHVRVIRTFDAVMQAEMATMKASADAYAQLASSSDDMLISEAALTLGQPRKQFFEYVANTLGWIYRRGGKWWPKQDAVQKGWMARRLHTFVEDGDRKKSYQTVMTNAGLVKVQQGLLPLPG